MDTPENLPAPAPGPASPEAAIDLDELCEAVRYAAPYLTPQVNAWMASLIEANDFPRVQRALEKLDAGHPGRGEARAAFEDRLKVLSAWCDFRTVTKETWFRAWRGIFERDFKAALEMSFTIGPGRVDVDSPVRPA